MKGFGIYGCILFFFLQVGRAQSTDSLTYFDQANDYHNLRREVLKAKQIDPRLAYYLARSFNQEDANTALKRTDSLLALQRLEESTEWRDRLLAHRLSLMRKQGKYREAIAKGTDLMVSLRNPVSLFDVAHNVSISYRRVNSYDSALRWGLPLIDQANALKDTHRSHRAIQNMANLYSALKEYRKALSMEKTLITIADRMENADLRVLDRCNLGSSYVNLREYDSARICFNEALTLAKQLEITNRLPLILYNMSSLEYREDQYAIAIDLLEEAITSAQVNDKPIILTRSRYLLALCFLEQNKLSQVGDQIALGIEEAKRFGSKQDRAYLLELRSEVFNRQGNYTGAITDLQSLRLLEDSIMNEERIETIEELRTQYETEKKEQQIASLEQDKTISDLQIRQQKALIIGGGVLTIILALIGFIVYRNRTLRLSQQRLLIEQRLLRSQMNPHFLFNALGAIHSYLFKGEKRDAAEYLSLFGELTREILDQSSREWITLKKELETLERYIAIQKLRFPNVSHSVDVAQGLDCENMLLPPMLLQPFVENAFEHGLKGKEEGTLRLRICTSDRDQIVFEIADDGKGLSSASGDHQSKAISITRDRLKLLYGQERYQLRVTNQKNNTGVLVSIALPIKEVL